MQQDLERPPDLKRRRKKWVYLAVAAFLFIPFILREISPLLEPYPAILLPGGASKVVMGDTVFTVRSTELLAVNSDGVAQRLEPGAFMRNVPLQYFRALTENNFGLAPLPWRSRWTNWFGRERIWSDEDRARTVNWLFEGAAEAGHPDAVALRVERVVTVIDGQDRNVLVREVVRDFEIRRP
jgi:hypothetical protein